MNPQGSLLSTRETISSRTQPALAEQIRWLTPTPGDRAGLAEPRQRGMLRQEMITVTHQVKQEVPADGVILDQMGCDVGGCVRGKCHQEVRSRYRQSSTCNQESGERIAITRPSHLGIRSSVQSLFIAKHEAIKTKLRDNRGGLAPTVCECVRPPD